MVKWFSFVGEGESCNDDEATDVFGDACGGGDKAAGTGPGERGALQSLHFWQASLWWVALQVATWQVHATCFFASTGSLLVPFFFKVETSFFKEASSLLSWVALVAQVSQYWCHGRLPKPHSLQYHICPPPLPLPFPLPKPFPGHTICGRADPWWGIRVSAACSRAFVSLGVVLPHQACQSKRALCRVERSLWCFADSDGAVVSLVFAQIEQKRTREDREWC